MLAVLAMEPVPIPLSIMGAHASLVVADLDPRAQVAAAAQLVVGLRGCLGHWNWGALKLVIPPRVAEALQVLLVLTGLWDRLLGQMVATLWHWLQAQVATLGLPTSGLQPVRWDGGSSIRCNTTFGQRDPPNHSHVQSGIHCTSAACHRSLASSLHNTIGGCLGPDVRGHGGDSIACNDLP